MGYDRYVLILGDADSPLGEVALRLLSLGLDPLYVADLDEGSLLARQEAARVGAMLVSSTTPVNEVERAWKRLSPILSLGPQTLIPVGARPDDGVREALRELGVRWALWEPYDEMALGFLVGLGMSLEYAGETRMDLRVPTSLSGMSYKGSVRKQVALHNLSAGGAYLATNQPFPVDTEISLEIPLPTHGLLARACVRHVKHADDPERPHLPAGMGVEFTNLELTSQSELRQFVEAQLERYAV
jgi:hypothetical protein